MVPVRELARAAGLEDAPAGHIHAALTQLVDAGVAEGERGPNGWQRVRGLVPLRVRAREFDRVEAPALASAATVRVPRGAPTPTALPAGGDPGRPRAETAPSGSSPEEEAEASDGSGGGWTLTPAAAWAAPGAVRSFSVTTRLPARRTGGMTRGMILFVVAVAAAIGVALAVVRIGAKEDQPPRTRSEWYQEVARAYVDGHRANRPGFAWPYRFTEISGVRENASRSALERGMERYLAIALYTGQPSQIGILAWARREFGEPPSGPAAAEWRRRVAETYATRALEGAAGYEITPAIRLAGGINPDEQDPTALTEGIDRALGAALLLGTPDIGGVLDWARRTIGDLPRE